VTAIRKIFIDQRKIKKQMDEDPFEKLTKNCLVAKNRAEIVMKKIEICEAENHIICPLREDLKLT